MNKILLFLEVAIVVLIIFNVKTVYLLVIPVLFVHAYSMIKIKDNRYEALNVANSLIGKSAKNKKLGWLLENSKERFLKNMISRYRLGSMDSQSEFFDRDDGIKELLNIVNFGLISGRNVCKSLELFVDQIKREINSKNMIRETAGNALLMTYVGVSIFVPLFGGVSSGILSNLGINGLQNRFLFVVETYIVMMLGITVCFEDRLNGIKQKACIVMPLTVVSTSILFGVPSIVNYIM